MTQGDKRSYKIALNQEWKVRLKQDNSGSSPSHFILEWCPLEQAEKIEKVSKNSNSLDGNFRKMQDASPHADIGAQKKILEQESFENIGSLKKSSEEESFEKRDQRKRKEKKNNRRGMNNTPTKVFISYCWEPPENKEKVIRLAHFLRESGIDCQIDCYEEFPPQGWIKWMHSKIDWAEFVIIICDELYNRAFKGEEESKKRLGIHWEIARIMQDLYEEQVNNIKFIPIVFSSNDVEHIPKILRPSTRYRLDVSEDRERLIRLLTKQPWIQPPPIGKVPDLPPLNPKQFREQSW